MSGKGGSAHDRMRGAGSGTVEGGGKAGGSGGSKGAGAAGVHRGAAGLPPTVDSAAFARKRGALEGVLPLAAMARLQAAGVAPRGDLRWAVAARDADDALGRRRDYLDVEIAFAPTMPCARCLGAVDLPTIRAASHFRFAATARQAEIEDREESELEVLAHEPEFDLAALVEDEAILALPMVAAHDRCPAEDAAASTAPPTPGDV
ncbi:MAG: DUF177 domain-containing protein [Lautropia sp.]